MTPQAAKTGGWPAIAPTGVLVLADGRCLYGAGFGAEGVRCGEVCFNTAMSGYQEILTDPSYASQLVVFSFPHIGNVGINPDDEETANAARPAAALGLVVREPPTRAANYRAQQDLADWLAHKGLIGLSGVNTRALVHELRRGGALDAALAHQADGAFDIPALVQAAQAFGGLRGKELARTAAAEAPARWRTPRWRWPRGRTARLAKTAPHVVVLDYGVKSNILRCLTEAGARVTIMRGDSAPAQILAARPDGIALSNGPGDPAATAAYALPVVRALVRTRLPLFGICLGHQLLALALGGATKKMATGHHGANHPVLDLRSRKVEIVSMNHGFTVARASLPPEVEETHVSLFDDSNCGLRLKHAPIFSVQYHPEASPGPQDSFYLFREFLDAATRQKQRI